MHEILGEFFENVLAPYLDVEHKESEKAHSEIRKDLKGIREEMSEIKEHIKDHDSRLGKVEALTALKN